MIDNEITILIVTYKSDEIILKNLTNLKKFNVIVIDNFKNSNLKTKIVNFTNVKYIKKDKNLGEALGADAGLKLIKTKYTLYLNPDTLIDEINILKLKSIFSRYDDTGLLTPLHLNEQKEYIVNYFAHPFNQKIKRNSFEKNIFKLLNNIKPTGDFFPRCIWGAPLFFNTNLIKKIGFFDTNFFLYFEDVDLCDRIIENKLKVIITPEVFCYHLNCNYQSKSIKYLFLTSSNFIFSQMFYYNKNNRNILNFYFRGIEFFLNSIIYLFKFNTNKFFQNIFRIFGIFKYFFFTVSKKIKF